MFSLRGGNLFYKHESVKTFNLNLKNTINVNSAHPPLFQKKNIKSIELCLCVATNEIRRRIGKHGYYKFARRY